MRRRLGVGDNVSDKVIENLTKWVGHVEPVVEDGLTRKLISRTIRTGSVLD